MTDDDYLFERVTIERLAKAMIGDVRAMPSPLKMAEARAIIENLGHLYRLRAAAPRDLTR